MEMETLTPRPTQRAPRGATRISPSLTDLFRASLWLGVIGFGGGVSVLGNIRHLAVERRRWVTEREFTNTATVAQMLPGGAASNALAHLGLRLQGLPGAVAAYTAFILPGALLTLALAWAYVRFGIAPRAEVVLSGLNAGVVGLVAALAIQMVRSSVGRLWQMGVAGAALLLSTAGGAASGEIAGLGIAAGLVFDLLAKRARLARMRRAPRRRFAPKPSPPVALPDEGQPLEPLSATRAPEHHRPVLAVAPLGLAAGASAGTLLALGLLFFRTGLGAYGGGFAIVPHLHSTAVDAGWITEQQFANAVAVGKLTPGPVLLMATFIGYVVRGFPGAIVATFTIFAAPFLLVVVLGAWLLRVRSRRWVRAALRGLTPAVVGLIAAAAVTLGGTLRGPPDVGIAAATALTLTRFRLSPALVLVIAGTVRWALSLAGV
ncbi:chromate efflux transporter [Anaeromyxobacter oryzae]|uniref:Chromate resistance transporter n=1 Tax=Anaeromyxobacter oryzae TaxID=2918170 RepID=A0ABN6MPM0_9BACT|nr:chromate efflux transporter [Anaeromyxobacter oryzae]BDG02326.1 chromate resistance transporter [Anaeromyxobacter oryzae]